MTQARLSSLGSEVRKHRGDRSLREAARVIGISPATLMRVESGRVPDVETFGKLCSWLNVDPKVYLGIKPVSTELASHTDEGSSGHVVVSAHFKADRLPKQETVKALATMIMFAVQARRQRPSITDGDT